MDNYKIEELEKIFNERGYNRFQSETLARDTHRILDFFSIIEIWDNKDISSDKTTLKILVENPASIDKLIHEKILIEKKEDKKEEYELNKDGIYNLVELAFGTGLEIFYENC